MGKQLKQTSQDECIPLDALNWPLTIEVEHSGIGSPVVYILDINGNILSYNQSNSISNNITISLPQTEGTYNVLIQSQVYSGIGVFYIY